MKFLRPLVAQTRAVIVESLTAIEDVTVSIIPQIVTVLTGVISTILIARGLGPVGLGQYALILSVSTFVVGLSDFGIGDTAIRYASRAASRGDPESQFAVLSWAFRLRMLFVLSVSIVAFALAPVIAGVLWHDYSLTRLIQLSLLGAIFTTLAHVPIVYWQSIRRFRTNSIILVAQQLLTFTGILLIAYFASWHLPLVVLVGVVTSGIAALAFIAVTPKAAFFTLETSSRAAHTVLKAFFSAPRRPMDDAASLDTSTVASFARFMFLSGVVSLVAINVDVWLMGIFLAQDQIGVYNAAAYVALPVLMLQQAISVALWPRGAAVTSGQATTNLLRKTLQLTLFAVVGASLYAIFGPLLMPLVFGPRYASGILLAQLRSFFWVIQIIAFPIAVAGYNFGLVRVVWLIHLLQLTIIVSLNVWLLPVIGPLAAALALVISASFGTACSGVFVWTKTRSFAAK